MDELMKLGDLSSRVLSIRTQHVMQEKLDELQQQASDDWRRMREVCGVEKRRQRRIALVLEESFLLELLYEPVEDQRVRAHRAPATHVRFAVQGRETHV